MKDDDNLKEFDQLRHLLKDAKRTKRICPNLKEKITRHNQLAAQLGLKVLSRKTAIDEKIKDVEHHHFQVNGHLPNKQTNADYSKLLSEKSLAKTILRNLNLGTNF